MTNRPKCNHPRQADDIKCADWSRKWSRIGGVLLLVGFLLPLVKRSMVANQYRIVWPWHLGGWSQDPVMAMVLGTYSEGAHPGVWTLLPLLGAGLAFLAARMASGSRQAALLVITGLGLLLSMLVAFFRENERLGLVFAPPTPGAGALIALAMALCGLIAATNHVLRTQAQSTGAKRWGGVAGIALCCIVLLFILGASGPWAAWPMQSLYGMVLVYALMAVPRLFGGMPGNASLDRVGKLGRLAAAWSVIAAILAQRADQSGFSLYVVQAGGGTPATILAALKGFAILFGSTLIMATGIASGFGCRAERTNDDNQ